MGWEGKGMGRAGKRNGEGRGEERMREKGRGGEGGGGRGGEPLTSNPPSTPLQPQAAPQPLHPCTCFWRERHVLCDGKLFPFNRNAALEKKNVGESISF